MGTAEKNGEDLYGRMIAIIGHKFDKSDPTVGKYVYFNVMWEKKFTRLEFSKLVTIDLAAKYVRRKNNEVLSKMYLEQKIAHKVLGYYYDDKTVKWVKTTDNLCQDSLAKYAEDCSEDNYIEVYDFVSGNNNC